MRVLCVRAWKRTDGPLRLHPSYRRTSETLSQAGLKATAAFSNVGSALTRKFEDVR